MTTPMTVLSHSPDDPMSTYRLFHALAALESPPFTPTPETPPKQTGPSYEAPGRTTEASL